MTAVAPLTTSARAGFGLKPARPATLVLLLGVCLLGVLFSAALALGLTALVPLMVLGGSIGLVVVIVLWQRPVRFVAVLLFAALVIEQYPIAGLNLITTQTHFFQSVSGAFHVPIPVQPAEILLLLALAAVLFPALSNDPAAPAFYRGALFRPVMLFLLAVLACLAYGVVSSRGGFSFNAAWAEARSFIYLTICYVLASNLINTRARLNTFVWIIIVALGLKGLQGIHSYMIEKQQGVHLDAITGHEDVVFFGTFFVLLSAFKIYGGPKRQQLVMLAFLLPLLFTELETGRRIAFFVLGMAYVVFGASMLRIKRQTFYRVAPVAALLIGAYTAIFWNHPNGALGQPMRAFKSQIGYADARDESSDAWRVLERENITRNIKSAPITGLGFGHEYTFYVAEPSLTTTDPNDPSKVLGFVYWTYITHCAIFWVWMKMGIFGYLAFWYLFGSGIVLGLITVRTVSDGYCRALAMTIVTLLIMQIMFSYGDLGLTYSRSMIYVGLMLGVLVRLPELAVKPLPGGGSLRAAAPAVPAPLAVTPAPGGD
ncbi:MAG TPA: hypothetical protein VFI42_01215 [Thermomicrobiaceae bacterium]|nr:hypothetical protein [Thermomicrobiaceae bacterium]